MINILPTNPLKKIFPIELIRLSAYGTGLLQGKAYSRLNNQLTQTLLPYKLSIPEWKLLQELHEHGKMRLAVLAEKLSYDPPMVTKLAKKLEKKNLAKRVSDRYDERAKVIILLPKGEMLLKVSEPKIRQTMRRLLKGISPDELRTYIKVLSVIIKNTE